MPQRGMVPQITTNNKHTAGNKQHQNLLPVSCYLLRLAYLLLGREVTSIGPKDSIIISIPGKNNRIIRRRCGLVKNDDVPKSG
jgi:hypothetical protein